MWLLVSWTTITFWISSKNCSLTAACFSCGHCSVVRFRNSGPSNHLDWSVKSGSPTHLVASSATFNKLGTYLHSLDLVSSKISSTRQATNGFSCQVSPPLIQCSTGLLSHQNTLDVILMECSCSILAASRAPVSAPINSILGIVIRCLVGPTLDLAATKRTSLLFSWLITK